jgi:hypothetical protein
MHDHTPLDAVDALFELRAELARLREREAELCDEIRSFATENGGRKVSGAQRVAVIETRKPRRISPDRLPQAVLCDPQFFETEEETVVLLWPRAATGHAVSSPQEVGFEADVGSVPEASDTVETEQPAPLDPAEGTRPERQDAPFVNPDDPFGLRQEATDSAPDAKAAPSPAVEDEKSPRDLRPTEHADLQPLVGLPEEDVAQLRCDLEADLASATLPDALAATQALEAKADMQAGLSDALNGASTPQSAEDSAAPEDGFNEFALPPATAFASSRLAANGES